MSIARRFRVASWTYARMSATDPLDREGPTTFYIDLLNFNSDSVEISEGHTQVVINDNVELTDVVYQQIRSELITRGLLSDGGLLAIGGDALQQAKDQKWIEIATKRDDLERKGFPYMGYTFDSDERSVTRLNTTANAAMFARMNGVDFTETWTTADNVAVPMTRDQLIGLPAALSQYAGTLHAHARDLREQIHAAESVDEVAAISWSLL